MPLCVKGFRRPSSPGVRCPSGAVSWPAGLGRGPSSWPIVAVVLPRLQVVRPRCAAGAPPGPAASPRQDGSDRGMASSAPGAPGAGLPAVVVVWWAGPGVACPKSRSCGVQAGCAGARVVPRLPSRAPGTRGSAAGIGLQAGVDGVADLPLQRPHGLFRGLALSQFLLVIRAALAVAVADLGDRGHVDGVVQPPVPAPGQPVNLTAAGGHLDGRGAVIGGEAVPAGEPGHVLDVADHGRGNDRADPGQRGQAGASGQHRGGERLPGRAQLRVNAAQVLKERGGELAAGRIHRPRGHDRAQQPGGGRRGDRLGDPAGDQLAQHRVQQAHHLGTVRPRSRYRLDHTFSTAA